MTYTYTLNGKIQSRADAVGVSHTTTYVYDGFDRLSTTTFPDSSVEQIALYDANDNVKTRINRSSQTLTYSYDALNRLLTKSIPASGSIPANTVTWSYDLKNEVLGLTDTLGNVLGSTYDLAGRKLSESRTAPGLTGTQTVGYQYNQSGDRTRITWPDSYFVNYTFDALDRTIGAIEQGTTTLASYDYDDFSQRESLQYATTAAKENLTWSPEGDLLTLGHDFAGTINDVTYTNAFNPAHQIATATISNSLFKYAPGTGETDNYGGVNTLNQYPSVTFSGTPQSIGYDTRGNLTTLSGWTYTYDPENQLMTAVTTGVSVAYFYDPLGRRSSKLVNSTATYFLDSDDTEIGEYDATGVLQRRFIPGPSIDEPIAMVVGATKTFFHVDKTGSIVAMSDGSGNLSEGPYLYDPFGNGAPTTGEPYKFTGQRLDAESGLYYFRARYYQPRLGRFLQTDPVGYNNDMNLYAYVGNDPTNKTDPSGDCPECFGALFGIGTELALQTLNPEDRAAYAQAWSDLRSGNVSGALGAAHSQLIAVGVSGAQGALGVGLAGKVSEVAGAVSKLSEGSTVAKQLVNAGVNISGNAAIGGTLGAAGQATNNAANGQPIGNGMTGAAAGGAAGGALGSSAEGALRGEAQSIADSSGHFVGTPERTIAAPGAANARAGNIGTAIGTVGGAGACKASQVGSSGPNGC